jgi:hypothetical protein
MRHCLLASLLVATTAGLAHPAAGAEDKQVTHKDFNRKRFSEQATAIDNQWLPLLPGTQFVFEGTANSGGAKGAHRVIFTVTDVAKWVNGVRTLVMWDRDIQDGTLVEEELAFVAQDDSGNVWNLGEYPEQHEGGKFLGAPKTWLAGHEEAEAGVAMRAAPRVKTSRYFQGLAPKIDFQDEAEVSQEHQRTCGPLGCYQDVLVVDEWNPLQQPQDGHQFKFYAPGVGAVRIEGRGGKEQETLVLTKRRHLSSEEMAQARERALRMDRRAYAVAPDVYRHTAFAEPLAVS